MELKGTKTEKNLMTAFAGESEARNKYTYYASKAKKDMAGCVFLLCLMPHFLKGFANRHYSILL